MFTSRITENTLRNCSLYIGANGFQDNRTIPGEIYTVIVPKCYKTMNDQNIIEETIQEELVLGTYNRNGWLSGMAKVYSLFNLQPGSLFELTWTSELTLKTNVLPVDDLVALDSQCIIEDGTMDNLNNNIHPRAETTYERFNLNHIHFDVYDTRLFDVWVPQTETDIYLAFGQLQERTIYQYVCGFNVETKRKLGYPREVTTPDAILIDRITKKYLIAEFKPYSSSFSINHNKADVDVLVVWIDDEQDRTKLPDRVVVMQTYARDHSLSDTE